MKWLVVMAAIFNMSLWKECWLVALDSSDFSVVEHHQITAFAPLASKLHLNIHMNIHMKLHMTYEAFI